MADTLPNDRLFVDHMVLDVEAGIAILLGAMIAAGGGLGGGGVFVPIYILILGYPPKFAAALSQATIFGGSIVNFIMNLRKSHPTRSHRPLTDFSTLLIFEPMLLAGTIIGVLLNVVCPDIIILILLALVLSYATVRTLRKGTKQWKKESAQIQADNEKIDNDRKQTERSIELQSKPKRAMSTTDTNTANDAESVDVVVGDGDHTDNAHKQTLDIPNESTLTSKQRCVSMSVASSIDDGVSPYSADDHISGLAESCGVQSSQVTADKVEVCQQIIESESALLRPLNMIAVVWVLVSLFALARKEDITGLDELRFEQCSWVYWMLTLIPLPFMMAVSFIMTKKEYKGYQFKLNSECWQPAEGDIELTGSFVKVLKYPLIASVAGILGGLLGIGGGMIVSPLLIELGVMPTVAAATSAMAVLITSSSAMLQFLLLSYLKFDYTFFFMAVGIVGTFIGQTAVNYVVKKFGRTSIVIFAVATIMGSAIILMSINGTLSILDGVSWAFSPPC